MTTRSVYLAPLILLACDSGPTPSMDAGPETDGSIPIDGAAVPDAGVEPRRIEFPGIGSVGVFDPSMATDPASGRIWLSYSAVDPSVAYPAANPHVVTTRLAYSDDHGDTWTDSGAIVNPAIDVSLPLDPPFDAGTWHNEVSTLVYDPGADEAERWKLFWHHYLIIAHQRRFEHGWLAYRAAPTPEALIDAEEIKLFAAGLYDEGNDIEDGPTQPPVAGAPVMRLDEMPDLAGCLVASEPTTYATSDALYLAFLCASAGSNDIALLRCEAPCEATEPESWTYLGTLLDDEAALSLGREQFSAPELFETEAGVFLLATPEGSVPFPDAYDGCLGFAVSNIESATLETSAGVPEVKLTVSGEPETHHGACDFDPAATAAGILYSQARIDDPVVFRIHASGRLP